MLYTVAALGVADELGRKGPQTAQDLAYSLGMHPFPQEEAGLPAWQMPWVKPSIVFVIELLIRAESSASGGYLSSTVVERRSGQ